MREPEASNTYFHVERFEKIVLVTVRTLLLLLTILTTQEKGTSIVYALMTAPRVMRALRCIDYCTRTIKL